MVNLKLWAYTGVTLKALANVSPGFALKPWVQESQSRLVATLKGLRGFAVNKRGAQLLQSCAFYMNGVFPGLPKRNPGLELANAFSVRIRFSINPFGLARSQIQI